MSTQFMDYSTLLNEAQYDAVSTNAQYVRIVAGAGSGKTRVLTYRVAYLISEFGVDPRRILAIAFTNKVAAEMKTRIGKTIGMDSEYVRVNTFHSFCAYFLRQEAHMIGYPRSYTIFDEDDQGDLVKDIGVSFEYKKGDKIIKEALEFIRKHKARGQYPDDIKNNWQYPQFQEYLKFYREYEARKTAMFALDFDDLLLKTLEILKNSFETREKWANRYDHILVDEFQDVNDTQNLLLQYLRRPDTCIYVVGDPDQTIYSWRGANQDIIMGFDKTFMGAETIILDRNYRSTKTILAAANKLIAHNKNRIPKDLYTKEEDGDPIVTKKFPTADMEATYVVQEIVRTAGRGLDTPNYKNIAVLYRSAYLTRSIERQLAGRGIPYKIFGGLRFYQRREVKDVIAYMRLISNSLDDVSFERIINVPRRGIGEASLDVFKQFAADNQKSLFDAISILESDNCDIPTRAISQLRLFQSQIEEVKEKLNQNIEVFSSVVKDFITKIGYFDYLIENEEPDEDRVSNVNALFDDMTIFVSKTEGATFDSFLQNVTLLTSQDDIKDGNYVSLMTVHVAKGLEFDNVFVIGLTDSAFPNPRALLEEERNGLEEERRLAYVAFTRAKKKLYLTCNYDYSFVSASKTNPSQFFTEAGLAFPCEDRPLFDRRETNDRYPGWKTVFPKPVQKPRTFIEDGDHISPFEENNDTSDDIFEEESNGIGHWESGDKLHHEMFGNGEVINVLDNNIIIVRFEDGKIKTIDGSHKMITKVENGGGKA